MGSLENPFFRKRGRGVTKKQYIGGTCGGGVGGGGGSTVCRFRGGGLAKDSNALYVDYWLSPG